MTAPSPDLDARWPLRRLQVEVVNVCNYRCPLCRTLERDGVTRRRMSPDELERVVAPVADGLASVALYGTRGEPFLHPDLEACVARVKALTRAEVDVSTNGSLVTPERARRVLDAGLDRLVFAVDGLSEESYGRYRKGGRLAPVLENLAALCALKRAGGYATRVVFQLIPMAGNEHELERVAEVAYGLGVDDVRLKLSSSVERSPAHRPRAARWRLGEAQPAAGGGFACAFGLDKLYVDPSGDCFPCCYAEGRPALRAGNALEASTAALWRSALLARMRAGLAAGAGQDPFCVRTCGGRARKRKLKLARPA